MNKNIGFLLVVLCSASTLHAMELDPLFCDILWQQAKKQTDAAVEKKSENITQEATAPQRTIKQIFWRTLVTAAFAIEGMHTDLFIDRKRGSPDNLTLSLAILNGAFFGTCISHGASQVAKRFCPAVEKHPKALALAGIIAGAFWGGRSACSDGQSCLLWESAGALAGLSITYED